MKWLLKGWVELQSSLYRALQPHCQVKEAFLLRLYHPIPSLCQSLSQQSGSQVWQNGLKCWVNIHKQETRIEVNMRTIIDRITRQGQASAGMEMAVIPGGINAAHEAQG